MKEIKINEANKSNAISRDRLYQSLGSVTQSLAAPVRLRILQILANKPCSVEALSQTIEETVGNTSQHLQKMLGTGLIRYKKEGVSRIYSLSSSKVLDVWLALQNLAYELVPQAQEDEEELCPSELCSTLQLSEILKLVKNNKAVLIDARMQDESESTPVTGAIPLQDFETDTQHKKLIKSKMIFVFCRGRYCALANPTVIALRKKGYTAFRMKETSYQINKVA